MSGNITDQELIKELESRPGLLAKYIDQREQSLREELLAVNKKLVISEQIKTDFLSNIRNEIINPVTALLELSQALADVDESANSKIAGLIFEESSKLNFQMRNILSSAEMEAGEAELTISGVDIDNLVQSTIKGFGKQLQKKQLEVETLGSASGIAFKTDVDKVQLILTNLLSNAIQFSYVGNKVEISYFIEEGQLHLSVKDYGIGITQIDQEEVFSRFTQLNRGTTKAYPGHGLGLSLTRALLEVLDGQLTLESAPEKGSTFGIHIPEAELDEDSLIYSAVGNEFLFGDSDEVF